jgi:mono/diheme cytochrome c family protein
MADAMKKLSNGGSSRRRRLAQALLMVPVLLLASSCRGPMIQDMLNQPKFIPLRENTFYPDLRSARAPVEGTVARGQLEDDSLLYTGMIDGKEADVFPFPITEADLARGRERFNIFCSPCHSQLGDGNGMIVQRGFKRPPSYLDPRLMKAPVGHFFFVISHGRGSMADYAAQVPVADRWRIAAYIRALQLAQTATPHDVPAGQRIAMGPPEQASANVTMARAKGEGMSTTGTEPMEAK